MTQVTRNTNTKLNNKMKTKNMNKWLTVLGIGSAVLLSQQVQATAFTVGTVPTTVAAISNPLTVAGGATLLATVTTALVGGITGSLTASVYNNDANNTYAGFNANNITFQYILTVTSGIADVLTLPGFDSGPVNIGYSGAVAPTGYSSPAFAGVIDWYFSGLIGTSATLVVQTVSPIYTPQVELVQDGSQSHAPGFGVVPDGGMTVMLLGAALSGLCLMRKKLVA